MPARQPLPLALVIALMVCGASQAEDEPAPFPRAVRLGDLEVRPEMAAVGRIPLTTITGRSRSNDDNLLVAFTLKNHSPTKRVVFDGWPHREAFQMNFTVKDEHGNRYRPVNFGLGSRVLGDHPGEPIEPGGELRALIVAEKPVAAATSVVIDLDGEAVGQPGKRLRWKLNRSDWEKGSANSNPDNPFETRWSWAHGRGSFRRVKEKRWEETLPNTKLQFVEVGRTDECVELKRDPETFVRLFPDRSEVKFPKDAEFHSLYLGAWERLTQAPSENARKLARPSRLWTSAAGGFTVEAKPLAVDATAVTLKMPDGSEMSVAIEALSPADRAWLRNARQGN